MSEVIDLEAKKLALREEQKKNLDEGIVTPPNAMEDALVDMNRKYAYVENVAGKAQVMHWSYDPVYERETIRFVSPSDIKLTHGNEYVPGMGGRNQTTMGQWWLTHGERRSYKGVFFDPKLPLEYESCYNTWRGIGVEPREGSWRRAAKHIYVVLCGKDPDCFRYVIRWIAWCLQNPGVPAECVLIFRGKEGAGKGFLFTQLCKIYKEHGARISSREHLTGKFNEHLGRAVFLFADEAYHPGDKEAEGVLKQLITEDVIAVEGKFKGVVNQRNCLHIGMATNQQWVIPISGDSRRYFINTVDDRYAMSKAPNEVRMAYFKALWGEMDHGGREAMVYDLLNMDLHGWHPRENIPRTQELYNQMALNQPKVAKAVVTWMQEGILPGKKYEGVYRVTSAAMRSTLEKYDPNVKTMSLQRITDVLKQLGLVRQKSHGVCYWLFPRLPIMKQAWDNKFSKVEWEAPDEEWDVTETTY